MHERNYTCIHCGFELLLAEDTVCPQCEAYLRQSEDEPDKNE